MNYIIFPSFTYSNNLILYSLPSGNADQVCKKCDRPWGSPADGCYERPHNITMVKALNTPKDQNSVKHEEFSSEEEEEEEIDYDKSYG